MEKNEREQNDRKFLSYSLGLLNLAIYNRLLIVLNMLTNYT